MYNVIFHLKMSLNYLKHDKKISQNKKEELYKEIEALLQKAEKIKQDFY